MGDGRESIRALATVTLDARALEELARRRSIGSRIWWRRGWSNGALPVRSLC